MSKSSRLGPGNDPLRCEDHRSKYADYLFENYATPHSKLSSEMWAEIPSNTKRKTFAQNHFILMHKSTPPIQ